MGEAIALKTLGISNCVGHYLQGFSLFFPTTRLKQIWLDNITMDDIDALVSFLASCAESLEYITLSFEPGGLGDQEPPARTFSCY